MPLRKRSARASFDNRASNGDASPDNRLAFMDHGLFAGQRAAGQELVIQGLWVYEHPVDFDGLRRFHHNLGYGLLGRRIERSPLPFARHRWVAHRGPSDIDIAECARPRAELSDWADDRAHMSADPELGPGWHLGVLPLTDGSTAVSLVVSHYLVDGLGLGVAVLDAVLGNKRDLGYPPPRSRTRRRAVAQDARQTAQDAPEIARALVVAAKTAREQARRRRDSAQSPGSRPVAIENGDEIVRVPGITVYVDLNDWDARAKALGGTSNALAAALTVKLAERLGRRRASDGAVTLLLPASDRTEGDQRANAVSLARVSVDPTPVTTDLHDIRAAVKQALRTSRETPDESTQLLWLMALMPKRALKRMADAAPADPDLPVLSSYLGDLGSMLRPDGTDAEYGTARGVWQQVTRQRLEQMGGQMRVQSWRISGKLGMTVVAYQPGAENTKPALRELAARTLAEFGLTGEID